MKTFDFISIGAGPAGQRAAVQAAKTGARVAVICSTRLGGVCINTGTVPSKTLREAIIDLSGVRARALYGLSAQPAGVTMERLLARARDVMQKERSVIQDQLERNGIDVLTGTASFDSAHVINVKGERESQQVEGRFILIGVGSRPFVPPGLPVDGRRVLTSDDILGLKEMPRRLVIAGGGVIGVEYASMFAVLGIDVSLCDARTTFLDMVDVEVRGLFREQVERMGVRFVLGEKISAVAPATDGGLLLTMDGGPELLADAVLVSAGRVGATDGLALEKAGLSADARGRIAVNESLQTATPHIYAAGDVIGAPQLASTSAEQGRMAACHALGVPSETLPALYPFGIYSVPEIAWVGATEQELKRTSVPYETGLARYRETARGNILGDRDGLLKMLIHRESRDILGVWICGTQASELIHIGQAAMALGGKVDYFLRTVFNYPTLAECYKVAALNGMNKLRAKGIIADLPRHDAV